MSDGAATAFVGMFESGVVFDAVGPFGDTSIAQVIVGSLCCVWVIFLLVRAWLRGHPSEAQLNDESYITFLPCYVRLLYITSITMIWQALVSMTIRAVIYEQTTPSAWVNGVSWGLHHISTEGLAFFLLHHSAGSRAMRRSVILGVVFGVVSSAVLAQALIRAHTWGSILFGSYNAIIGIWYCIVWLAPATWFYRRPALVPLAAYWTIVRFALAMCFFVVAFNPGVGAVLYLVFKGLIFNLVSPGVLYNTLLADSRFWQGHHSTQGSWFKQLIAPLDGVRFSGNSAAGLRTNLDSIVTEASVKLLNYAALEISSKLLGSGGQARVYQGKYRGTPVAVKTVFCMELTGSVVQDFCNEARLLTRLMHPNVVKAYGVCVVPPTIAIVLELCENGSLTDVLSPRARGLSWRLKLKLCRDCANAIVFLHSKGAVHKDIKSGNYLVTADMTAKLADLGVSETYLTAALDAPPPTASSRANLLQAPEVTNLTLRSQGTSSTTSGRSTTTFRGTLAWAAPEVLTGGSYTPAADVYSLTFVLWEILAQQLPFNTKLTKGLSPAELSAAIAGQGNWQKYRPEDDGHEHHTEEGLRPALPLNTPADFASLLRAGWAAHPATRPRADVMLTTIDSMISKLGDTPSADALHQPRWPEGRTSFYSLAADNIRLVSTVNPLHSTTPV